MHEAGTCVNNLHTCTWVPSQKPGLPSLHDWYLSLLNLTSPNRASIWHSKHATHLGNPGILQPPWVNGGLNGSINNTLTLSDLPDLSAWTKPSGHDSVVSSTFNSPLKDHLSKSLGQLYILSRAYVGTIRDHQGGYCWLAIWGAGGGIP